MPTAACTSTPRRHLRDEVKKRGATAAAQRRAVRAGRSRKRRRALGDRVHDRVLIRSASRTLRQERDEKADGVEEAVEPKMRSAGECREDAARVVAPEDGRPSAPLSSGPRPDRLRAVSAWAQCDYELDRKTIAKITSASDVGGCEEVHCASTRPRRPPGGLAPCAARRALLRQGS